MPDRDRALPQLHQIGLAQVAGIGPKLQEKLLKMGLRSVEDALYHLPLRYEDRRQFKKISQLLPDRQEVFYAKVLVAGEVRTSRSNRRIFEIVVGDDTGRISLKWFHYRKSWLQKRFPLGQSAVFVGEVRHFAGTKEVHHPDAELLAEGDDPTETLRKDPLKFGRVLPVYPLTEGLTQYQIRKLWFDLVQKYAPSAFSPIPKDILGKREYLPLDQALAQCHWPAADCNLASIDRGADLPRNSIVYDEFFFLELGLALKRHGVEMARGIAFTVEHLYTKPLNKMLPFQLTAAQRRVLGEIKHDMMSPTPMHRLLQGDVGSGKTIVALMASLIAIENQTQVAIVAPTEILAEQHYTTFNQWLEKLGLNCALLRSGTKNNEKKRILNDLSAGRIHLLVGTHAVLQDGVEFQRLGLGVIDEQHRFGVRQRGILKQKGENPDILVMTATPIPRTLSMTLYGDLALSIINELPPGRTPVKTVHYPQKNRIRAYDSLASEITAGKQAYIVYPLVEETENSDLFAATEASEVLRRSHPQFRIGLLHGRLSQLEKDAVMQAFRSNALDILVATTVIEVGVDVPNASLMIIEHADRFGLSQLHQLRGRVGRGVDKSSCYLISSESYSEEARRRLAVMVETNDGFRIAEADLEIRGPGEFLGTKQSGLPDFRIASLLKDGLLLEQARQDAFTFAAEHQYLENTDCDEIREELFRRWGGRLELASIG